MTELQLSQQVEYAKLLAASDLLPDAYKGKPANILLAIEYGKTLGITPMAAIQGINVIKGKPTASASLISSLVRLAGHRLRVTSDNTKAVCEIIRADDPEYTFMSVWDMERAKSAGLTANPSWQKYPEAMMKARAITECARDACPEVLSGVQYTAEELGAPEPAPSSPHRIQGIDPWAVAAQPPATTNAGHVPDEPEEGEVIDA